VQPAGDDLHGDGPSDADLDVAIVSYRCKRLLRRCLASLREHPPCRTIVAHVVDNASGDGTAEIVERDFPEVRLTRSPRNLGFGAANNVAIRAGRAPYVLVLNPDTAITEGALDRLLELMDARAEIGICGPRLVREDGSFDHAAKRAFPTTLGALAHFTGLGRRERAGARLAQYRAPHLDPDRAGPVDAVNGAFMLIRRRALDEVGLFDEGFWMYMEDLDLCYRFARAGWTTWYEPSATVLHVKAGTSGPVRSLRLDFAFHYGMYRFYRKHYGSERNPLANAAVYGGIAGKLALSLGSAALRRARRKRDLPLPPRSVRFMGEDDETFLELGDAMVDELAAVAGLRLDRSRVLDIGCGYGRLAHALLRRGFAGRYLGVDVLKRQIGWCDRKLGRDGVEFRHGDVRNECYNPHGDVSAGELRLEEDEFDVVALYGVFTHMWPGEVTAYLGLIRSFLVPDGRALATFFLLDDEWRELDDRGVPFYPLPHRREPHCRYMSEESPLQVVAYELAWILEAVADAGLSLARPPRFGTWSGRQGGGPGLQDALVLSRAKGRA
jgi:N-acetylglucosaminyl-diphospho-decaprenol L-rhamnosyltransferase